MDEPDVTTSSRRMIFSPAKDRLSANPKVDSCSLTVLQIFFSKDPSVLYPLVLMEFFRSRIFGVGDVIFLALIL